MAKQLYSKLKKAASGILKQMGSPAVITSRENGTLKGYSVFLDSNTSALDDDMNTKTIYFQGSDKDPSPAPGDVVTFAGSNWGIKTVEDYNPDGSLTIMFKLGVSK